MRLFWGKLEWLLGKLGTASVSVVGTISSERRCLAAPFACTKSTRERALLIEVQPEQIAPPSVRTEMQLRIARRRAEASQFNLRILEKPTHLLATEDELIGLFDEILHMCKGSVLVLDISSFPKRIFCFFVKLLLSSPRTSNVVVAYTDVGFEGYPKDPLSYSPLPADYIPGFPFIIEKAESTQLVVTLGFEPLGLRRLIKEMGDQERPEFIMATSSDSEVLKRLWDTARDIAEGKGTLLNRLRFFSPRDVEGVYRHLSRETQVASGVTIAPYGAKLHTLAATLYCLTQPDRAAMIYTQPQWYNPDYSTGVGESWGYVIKWDGVSCLDRPALEF